MTSRGGGIGALRFTLEGVTSPLQYLAKAGEAPAVATALAGAMADAQPVRVLAPRGTARLAPSDVPRGVTVYEVTVGGRLVRGHAAVARAWGTDESIGRAVAVLSAMAGMVLLLGARRRR